MEIEKWIALPAMGEAVIQDMGPLLITQGILRHRTVMKKNVQNAMAQGR